MLGSLQLIPISPKPLAPLFLQGAALQEVVGGDLHRSDVDVLVYLLKHRNEFVESLPREVRVRRAIKLLFVSRPRRSLRLLRTKEHDRPMMPAPGTSARWQIAYHLAASLADNPPAACGLQ
jgi:hypothetical protein